eukprot:GCRY01000906.1.p3 GENE.GCRY01000906.1~~GCRY01000906.1.p3  ORF type:complete len:142 (+),score=4.75 GCRY01000906.1:228-653(+)
MSGVVHYKFKSQREYDSITFNGVYISKGDVLRQIIQDKNLTHSPTDELRLCNAETNEEYENDGDLIPNNTSLLVRRVPCSNPTNAMSNYAPKPSVAASTKGETHSLFSHKSSGSEADNFSAIMGQQDSNPEWASLCVGFAW